MAAQSPVKSPGASGGGQPVDYSFRELKSVSDLIFETPVTGHARRPPVNGDTRVDDYLESIVADGPKNGARLNANSVRLCNNQLTSLQGLDKALYHVLDDPRELVWLDASCCKLQGIDDIITQFPNLQVLYLHGNQVWHLSEVLKLQQLPQLRKLTLHGNHIAEQKNYKLWVLAHLPNLRSLDFSTVTNLDRDKVDTWFKGYQKAQAAKC
mmetsp:Transcript_32181/g.96091  ORF Transcript_32181/g.96091 Transcript_32181/m.96091 type:complete len:210 (-) Transcript_32181:82-711(-)